MQTLRELRKAQGLSMRQLGELVGVTESAISLYELGKREPDYSILQKLAAVLHTSVEYLMTGHETVRLQDLTGMSPEAIAELVDSLPGFPRLGTDPHYHAERFPLSDLENSLIGFFRSLNPVGQKMALDVIKALVDSGSYSRPE